LSGRLYVVSGTRFYRVRYEITAVSIDDLGEIGTPDSGTIPDYTLMYTIAAGANACVVCVPPRAYTCGHFETDALNQIGGDFPGAASVAFLDGYHVYTGFGNDAKFFVTRLLDPSNYDALDFAYSDALPNVLRRVVSLKTDLWMMGEGGIEVWYDAGQQDFPFRRRSGGVISITSGGPKVVTTADNSVFWVGGDFIVYRTVNYEAQRVSTHAIERIIEAESLYFASAFSYIQGGHIFYVLSFADRSLVYDCATKLWHDRSSAGAGRWRPSSVAALGNTALMGDSESAKIFKSDTAVGTEDGSAIVRQIVFPPLLAPGNGRVFCVRFELEMETDNPALVDEAVTLDWSDDGGYTFQGGPRTLRAGIRTGRTRTRVYTTRLGSFRERVFRLTMSGMTTIFAADADITAAAS
jgi:hypothetical protein